MRAKKGSAFEREISKRLSLWWTEGVREDVFWRSAGSGSRATTRAKQGKTTHGSYGDIATLDPIGDPLLEMFTIELKRGNTIKDPWDLVDELPGRRSKPQKFEEALEQVVTSQRQAGSLYWMLLCKKDGRVPMVYVPRRFVSDYYKYSRDMNRLHPTASFKLLIRFTEGVHEMSFCAFPLEEFLDAVVPGEIVEVNRHLRRRMSKKNKN
ncbi:MAG: hypothetical protein Unbinned3891contig1000_35 [Prokaryotic dsDNA virus sp.]|nr:MAG: hypothetical protein Unbinned3891contig1000_35 [Prokaryotic dsDNA virus sp.]|tara:strand:- start:914 stop:1540 length:627 start_codon:yes stop_codon:yes gene_type:complete